MRYYLIRMPGGDLMEFVAKSECNALERARKQARRDAREAAAFRCGFKPFAQPDDVHTVTSEKVR